MQFDTTLKELFQTLPHRLVEQLCGSRVVEGLNVEQPSVKVRRPDLVARLATGQILHVEVQGADETAMPWRMLEYYAPLRHAYGQPPWQIVLYIGDARLRVKPRIREERLRFSYDVIDARTLDSRPLLASDSISDNLLAILCDVTDVRAVSRRILKKLTALPSKQAKDAVVKLTILSKLRRAEKIVIEEVRKTMPLTREDLLELPLISELVLFGEQEAEARGQKKGERQGEKRGKREEARKLLSIMLEHRFGVLPGWAKDKIAAADLRTLEQWSVRLLKAQTLEEAVK